MLTLALVATLIGFGLLVVALITGNFWLAVACIVVCVIGLLVLLVDTVRSSRRGAGTGDEPLFTIHDRESGERAAPLHDDDREHADSGATVVGAAASGTAAVAPAVSAEAADSGPQSPPGAVAPVSGGLGSLVDRSAGTPTAPPSETPVPEPLPAGPASDTDLVTGDANDYVKSVTGSFPIQSPSSGPWPAASSPVPTAGPGQTPAGPGTPGGPSADRPHLSSSGPDTGPLPAASPYVGRRRRAADEAGAQPDQAETPAAPAAPTAPAAPVSPPSTAFLPAGPAPAAWTRQNEPTAPAQPESDGLVVHDHTGPLPKMTFKNEEG